MIREINENDFDSLMSLYTQLHNNQKPEITKAVMKLWNNILNDSNHHIIVFEENGKIVSSCVLVIIPNLTHDQRPYALIENVITDIDHRKKGLATQCLNYASRLAENADCYKIMLLTGAKDNATLEFYRRAGFNSEDKTGFIKWL